MRLSLITAALVAGVLAVPAGATADPCAPWTVKVLATGLGSLENVEPDGKDGLLYSASGRDAVERLTRDGRTATVAAGLPEPGGLRVRGQKLYVNTGDGAAAGALGTADGTIQEVDLRTGAKQVWASGLTMPNGLVFLPDGSALVSRDITGVAPTGITRVAKRGAAPQVSWADQDDSNGLAVDPTGTFVYADETFTAASNVYRIRIADPSDRTVVASLAPSPAGVFKGLDDLTISTTGALYVTANGAGEVIRLDPITGRHCVVASGLTSPSAVKQGSGQAFPASRLYVSGFDGRLLELVPPSGVTP